MHVQRTIAGGMPSTSRTSQVPVPLAEPRCILSFCRERLSGRIAKLETQLASATERAEAAERQLVAVQQEADEELQRLRQEAAAQLAEARQAAAAAREQTEQQSAR